ncbi:FAD-dependent monooxygenase [Pararhizobium sp.]|uniref:FAD-dependent monooxygenase n=1 Tax=Pararhizobium sp. TaxID=1977563 RepID=UPI00271E4F75|nr:FAD-dependent monooxygenase [Pararhizobium sp.]MDO9415394.1 FAD-dependent monooxygenase [Pararhizobium sp.]
MSIRSAAIAGAGIAGLTAALALAAKNIRVEIFEQTAVLSEAGAGLQLSPNATRILDRLGLLSALEAAWIEPDFITLTSGDNLRTIATVPAGSFARKRWGAPYGVLHRATLQRVLLDAVENHPLCRLNRGCKLTTADPAEIAAVTGMPPDLVIGADGVWSQMRAFVPGTALPRFSGHVAWRFMVAASDQPSFLSPDRVSAFLGARSHLVAYPLKETGGFNVVAIFHGSTSERDWSLPAGDIGHAALLAAFLGWHPQLLSMLREAAAPTLWPLYDVSDGPWQDGRSTVLIGDAAHAMMPFAAQGAAMAIEDAFELAALVAARPLPAALTSFEQQRRPRVAKVRARAAFNRFAYHARGPIRLGRDLVLSLRSPESLAADFDWLYGYDSEG